MSLRAFFVLKTMRDICAAINTEAGTIIVDEQHYLPPWPVLSGFGFTRGQTEYVMQLELWGPRPSLVLSPVSGVTLRWTGFSLVLSVRKARAAHC